MMNLRKTLILFATAALTAGLVTSCKDDEKDEPTYENFIGTLKIDLPAYLAPGETYKMTPGGVRRNSSDSLKTAPGYYWTISVVSTGRDTTRYENSAPTVLGAKVFTAPDSLCTLTVTCAAFAKGYYNATAYAYPTVVMPGNGKDTGSMTNIDYPADNDFTDTRDGKTYHATKVGNTLWMAQNLAYSAAGKPYGECVAMEDVLGHFYSWNEIQTACPDGWEIPSDSDWKELASAYSPDGVEAGSDIIRGLGGKLMADVRFNGEKMWFHSPDNKITNESGFSAIPGGYAYMKNSGWYFAGAYDYAAFWIKDEAEGKGQYRYFHYKSPDVLLGSADKTAFLAPLRCVKRL